MVSIVGTRPEAIKMAPVIRALAERPCVSQQLILTGQHPLGGWMAGSPPPPVHKLQLDLSEQTPGEICELLQHALCSLLLRLKPDLVLVQGDTTSALAGALAARDCGIPVGHVEAGLRSGDLQQPWPEEGNRIRIDALADLLFAPTACAAASLGAESVVGDVHVTGNTGIDALLDARGSGLDTGAPPRKSVLVTCHRRENWRELDKVAAALKRLARELSLPVRFVRHLNPALRAAATDLLRDETEIELLDPLDYEEMVQLMDRSWLILTDSGGVQEEGPALGKPVLVLRDVTERPEAIETDNIELVGTDPDRIVAAAARLVEDSGRYQRMSRPSFPFGDGHAAPRIAALVEDFLTSARRAPETPAP